MKATLAALAGMLAAVAMPLRAAAQDAGDDGARPPSSTGLQVDAVARVDAVRATQRDDGKGLFIWTGQFKTLAKFSDDVRGALELRVSKPGNGHPDEGAAIGARVLEGYVSRRFAASDLRIGKQIVAWGRADGVNPTDNLSPRDYVTWLPFEDDQRFGAWAVRYDAHLERALDLTVLFLPWFESSVVAKPATADPVATPQPARNAANSQFAVKLNQSAGKLDWSVSYFRGLSLLPTARLTGMNDRGPQLEFRHDRVQVLGADTARNFGRFGFRAEAAWTWPSRSDDGAPATRQPDFFCVAGLDRTWLGSLYANVQLFGRRVQGFVDPYAIADPAQRAVAVQNAITAGQQDRTSAGYTVRVSNKWLGDTLEAELLLINNLTRGDRFARPVLTYAVTDRLKAALGAVIFQGADDTVFGRKKADSRYFIEVRYAM